jgi:hypothetical protein
VPAAQFLSAASGALDRALAILPVDGNDVGNRESLPEEGNLLEFLLGDAANIVGEPGEQDCWIEAALVVGYKDVGLRRVDIREPLTSTRAPVA